MRAPAWLRALFVRDTVSESWLASHAAESTKTGWDGPRWRSPKERADMARRERRAALRVVPMRRAAK